LADKRIGHVARVRVGSELGATQNDG
jgi:hypothetical protein